jgi:hypothetical protein
VLVDDIRLEARGEQWELSGRITMDRLDTQGLRIWFRFPGEYSAGELDASPFLPGLLVTSMWWNEKLIIDGPASARLLRSADEAMALYRCVYPELPAIGVSAPSHELPPGKPATACLFSRGIDSWYSVLRNLETPDPRRPPLTHLVYVPSIDFMYGDDNRARSIGATREAAEEIGCELVLLETNLRHFTEQFQHWGVTFGGGLAGMGLALGAGFSHVLLASSVPIGEPNLSGSHPELDPLWSTERTTIVHDGSEARRLDKARLVSDHPEVLPHLKVCFVADTAQNCGRCDKCLITMIELHIAGMLGECPAFECTLDPRAVARILHPGWQRFYLAELLDALGDGPLDIALRLALEKVLLREELHSSAQRVYRLMRTRLTPVRSRLGQSLLARRQRKG